MDSDRCSVHSAAPSYTSEAPSYSSARPPAYVNGANTARPRRYSSLLADVPIPSPRPGTSPRSNSLSKVPPLPQIKPGSALPKNRLANAVAARRQIESAANEEASTSKTPQRPRLHSRALSTPNISSSQPPAMSPTFSTLYPAPTAANRPRVHSTSELFLCTCGRKERPKYPRVGSLSELATQLQPPYPLEEPNIPEETDEQKDEEREHDEEAIRISEEELRRKKDKEAFIQEGKSWDFLLAQMADWDSRAERWEDFKKRKQQVTWWRAPAGLKSWQ